MESFADYYAILDVNKDAYPTQIKNTYLALINKLHPELDDSPSAHERFLLVNEAYSILINPLRRRKYDQLYEAYINHNEHAFKSERQKQRIELLVRKKAEQSEKKAVKRESQNIDAINDIYSALEWFFNLLDGIFNLLSS